MSGFANAPRHWLRRLLAVTVWAGMAAVSSVATWGFLSRTEETRHSSVCATNLRGLATALALYADDHDDVLPSLAAAAFGAGGAQTRNTWLTALMPYRDNHLPPPRCPSREVVGQLRYGASHPNCYGYAMNGYLMRQRIRGGQREYGGIPRTCVKHPALTVALCDARTGIIALRAPDAASDSVYGIYLRKFEADILTQTPGATRHYGGANYAFMDGHAEWHRARDFRRGSVSDGDRVGFGL